ncbi:hypothetical protein EVAR_33602_1 [Eumeta japonica]|uniref:Uncharacterized protein n=1 Tax=Eumeta variegata TaxID=151549 RepID=A0A4C1WCP0_EUMVA|nr:hypothetical protein EVAR_33602_1 [Eumeta japonica]
MNHSTLPEANTESSTPSEENGKQKTNRRNLPFPTILIEYPDIDIYRNRETFIKFVREHRPPTIKLTKPVIDRGFYGASCPKMETLLTPLIQFAYTAQGGEPRDAPAISQPSRTSDTPKKRREWATSLKISFNVIFTASAVRQRGPVSSTNKGQ